MEADGNKLPASCLFNPYRKTVENKLLKAVVFGFNNFS